MNPDLRKKLRDLAAGPYEEAKKIRQEGKTDRLIAWVTSDNPHSILEAMGVTCLYPENHAAACGARKKGVELCEISEAEGYDRTLCSYFRINLGSVLADKLPEGIEPLPRPDFILSCNNICSVVGKWYQILGEYLRVPVFSLDIPPAGVGDRIDALNYVKEQLLDLVKFLEEITGRPFDYQQLEKVMAIGASTTQLWEDILGLAKQKPAPISAFDGFYHMGPIVTQRVMSSGCQYYGLLKADILQQITELKEPAPREKYRLFWDNIAIWYKLRDLSQKLADLGAKIVVSSYTSCWAREEFINLDFNDPLKSIAKQLMSALLNQSLESKTDYCLKLMKEFSVDGAIIHANRSCASYTRGGLRLQRAILEELGLPSIIIEADQCDPRYYQEDRVNDQLNTLIEILRLRGR